MFTLVKFAMNKYGIYPSKNICELNSENLCIVKHGGGKYEAELVSSNDSKETLKCLQKNEQEAAKDDIFQDVSIGTDLVDLNRHFSPSVEYTVDENSPNISAIDKHYINEDLVVQISMTEKSNCDSFQNSHLGLGACGDYDDFSSDDTRKDSDYKISSDEDDDNSDGKESVENENFSPTVCETSRETINQSLNVTGLNTCFIDDMYINKSVGRNGDKKANFCMFCKKKNFKIARHLETIHKDEKEVQKFALLPKGSLERRKIIEVLRKQGNYIFNTDKNYNDGELIVSRRPNQAYQKNTSDYKACGSCKAYFSKNTLRNHFRKCARKVCKDRTVMVLSKGVMGRIHHKATRRVRKELFPPLREDLVVKGIRYDETVIIYCNKMVQKYKHSRYFEMIRQRVRLLGRFMLRIRTVNKNISDLASVFDPQHIDDTIFAINVEAGLDEINDQYKTPTVAFNLGTLLKQTGNMLINEYIKKHDSEKKINVENFLQLLSQEISIGINRTVAESQLQVNRRKKVELPSDEDIQRLHFYLSEKRRQALEIIKSAFSHEWWLKLSETTLTSIQLFNRRRAGEVERVLIDDFNAYQGLNENTDKEIFKTLTEENKSIAKKYVRFVIRGKLNRSVPVLLDENLLECVKTIIKYREEANVPPKNPYVFGVASSNVMNKHLKACTLLRKFAEECGASHPARLRGTKLRKHIATTCISLNLSENEISDLADFMGHKENIHKTFYRQPVINRQILRMSKLLEVAQGKNNEDSDESEEEDETHNEEHVVTKKRSTSPYGSVKRRRWLQEEKDVVFSTFKDNFENKNLPSLERIQLAISENDCLRGRTSAQIKTWIHNQWKKRF